MQLIKNRRRIKEQGFINPKVLVFLVTVSVSLTGCGGGGGGGGGGGVSSASGGGCPLTYEEIQAIDNISELPTECLPSLPTPETNLLGRIFVLGTQIDQASGALRIFSTGTDINDNPLQLADFQAATVSINGIPANPALVSVEPIADGSDVLSMAFVTDYSTSISNAELNTVSGMYSQVLASLMPPKLPQILEGQVVNFSNSAVVVEDWTESVALLQAAFLDDGGIMREQTAFYDALGITLQRDLVIDNDGLVERCRPAHMLVTFTDGGENASVTYTKGTVQSIIDDSKAVMIMLGGLSANKDMLVDLAGDNGAFVYAYSLSDIEKVVGKWANSLSHMVQYTLDPATGFDTGPIIIRLGSQTVIVERPVDGFCESTL